MIKNKCKVCLTSWETATPVKRCKNCGRSLTYGKNERVVFVDNVDKKVDKLSKAKNVFREDDDES